MPCAVVSENARLARPRGILGQLADRPRGVRIVAARHEQCRATAVLLHGRLDANAAIVKRWRDERQRADCRQIGRRERREARAKRRSGDADRCQSVRPDAPNRYDTLARTSALHAPRTFESPGSDMPGRSIASARIFASARRWPTASQSSFGRPSIGTSTTAGAGRCEGSKTNALIVRPSSARNDDAAAGGERGATQSGTISQDRGPEGSAPRCIVRSQGHRDIRGRSARDRQTARG